MHGDAIHAQFLTHRVVVPVALAQAGHQRARQRAINVIGGDQALPRGVGSGSKHAQHRETYFWDYCFVTMGREKLLRAGHSLE